MPSVKRRPKRRRDQWGPEVLDHLREGMCPLCIVGDDDHDGDALKPAWEELKHSLLPEYVRQYPGTRPFAWWKWDAPDGGRRLRIDGQLHPFDNSDRAKHVASVDNPTFWKVAYRLIGGLPSCFIPPFDAGLKTEMFEAEWEFLVRHNLLLPEDAK